jgi:EAL domain-containing protein (putative c-di-GMP-specific phosphodiesterase class I)
VDDVSAALDHVRLDPEALVLEITESVLVSEMAPIRAVLERLRTSACISLSTTSAPAIRRCST